MNLILLENKDIQEKKQVILQGRRAKHILEVLKPEIGHSLKVGIFGGNIGLGKVLAINTDTVELELGDVNTPPPKSLPVTLLVAMQRPKTLRKILQCATAMGVKEFIIMETWKVEKSYWSSPLLNPDKLEEQFLLGLEQAGDTIVPKVQIKKRFKPFVEDELPRLLEGTSGFIAHPHSSTPCPYKVPGRIKIAIGPEGGFTDYEVEKMETVGMQQVSMGARVFRSEFALAALLGRIC